MTIMNSKERKARARGRKQGYLMAIDNVISENKKYMKMLIDAMNNTEEDNAIHNALADIRATEYRVRCELNEQLERLKAGVTNE